MAYDKIIIGAGLYGLYAARYCGRKGEKVLVLESEPASFLRATTVNQARVHMGYHYPRSLSTAKRSADYFERFVDEFGTCIKRDFEQVYATSSRFSWTDAEAFFAFCRAADIPCEELPPGRYFQPGMCDGAFLTREYTYDATALRRRLLEDLAALPGVQLRFSCGVTGIRREGGSYLVDTAKGEVESTGYLLNATYASVNGVLAMLGKPPFPLKYELCELILCRVGSKLRKLGITVMDGPFFSIMPFGHSGVHSLTSVTFTPHQSSHEALPTFACQAESRGACTPGALANCNECPARPKSAWPTMRQLAEKYLLPEYDFHYGGSMYSMKPILTASEVDDSRPTLIRVEEDGGAVFTSVLSGKINTVYDLEEVL